MAVLAQTDHSLPPAMAPGQPTMPRCSSATCHADLLRFFRQHELHTILVPDVQARRHASRIAMPLFVWPLPAQACGCWELMLTVVCVTCAPAQPH